MPSSKTAPTLLGHTFKDGTSITPTDLHQAKMELTAFLLFIGKGHNFVLRDREEPIIQKFEILDPLPDITPRLVEITARHQVSQIKPRFSRRELTPEQLLNLQMGTTTTQVVAFEQGRQKVMNALKPIAGRPEGWTLLGIEKEKDLLKLIRVCYRAKAADDVSKCDLIPYEMVLQLLARKNRYAVPPAAGKSPSSSRPKSSSKVRGKKRIGKSKKI